MKKILFIVLSLYTLTSFGQRTLRIISPIGEGGETTYYRDADGDTYGNKDVTITSSTPLSGWVLNPFDCDDTNPSLTIGKTWYKDEDGDGFGDPNTLLSACTQPRGYVENNVDTCPTVYGTNNGCPPSLTEHNFGDKNYIYEEVLKVAATEATYNSIAESSKIRSISYFDGLGRKTQTRAIGQSPLGKDIVTHHEYDALGRASKGYLPYVSTQNNGFFETGGQAKTLAYYNTSKYENTTNPYSEQVFDGSPLNRVKETGAPGIAWKVNTTSDYDHTTKMGYATNTATSSTYKVRWYKVSLSASYVPSLTNPSPYYYPTNSLFKTVVKDENWSPASGKLHTTEAFKNKFGQTILKRTYAKIGSTVTPHDTYYVYDIYNNLTYVLSPNVNTADGISTTELNELCYQYKYDKYNRLIEKKLPGKGWEYMVYDKADRPILTQDALGRAKSTKEWLFTKYDALGRVVYSGVYKSNSTRTTLQAAADAHSVKHEKRGTSLYYYTNTAYPTGINSSSVYTVNYYDDYSFDRAGLNVPATVYGVATTTNVKSLATGVKERVLDANNAPTSHWVTSITGYDDKARVVYAASKNSFLGTTDTSQTKLDFVGAVTETSSNHTSNTTISIVDKFTYDHVGRLLTQKQKINTQPEELIVKNKYDELGVLENKKVGNTEALTLQTIDYKYNVRGWLTDINNVNAIGTDLFTFKVNYNSKDIAATTGYTSLYNGNIAETVWRTKTDNKKRAYQYKYDGLSRILGANYRENDNLLSGSGKFETSYGYDKNGNIKNLTRKGNSATSIDNLVYTITNETNKLAVVNDNSGNYSEGFQANQSNYTYDVNGNLIKDTAKGITSIEYNHLNLPLKVHFGSSKRIEYIYTAGGAKLQKKKVDGSTTTTNYAGGFIYENNVLKHFSQPEGYVEISGSSFTYVYQYADHLGNIRLNYTNVGSRTAPSLQIRDENHYYPFGMKHQGYGAGIIGTQNDYKYNGKEYQDEIVNGKRLDWYDYGARNYDVTLGRWFVVDAYAEAHPDLTPYRYGFNNPVKIIDPDGNLESEIEDIGGGSVGVGNYYELGPGASINADGSISGYAKGGSGNSGNVRVARYADGTVRVISEKEYQSFVNNGGKVESSDEFLNNGCCGGTGNGFRDALAFQEAMNPVSGITSKNAGTKTFLGGTGRAFGITAMGLSYSARDFARLGSQTFEWGRVTGYSKYSLEMTSRLSSYARIFGRSAGWMSIGLNLMDYKEGNVTGVEATTTTGFSLYGMFGGPVGLFWSGSYFLFDLAIPYDKRMESATKRANAMKRDLDNGVPVYKIIQRYSCFVKGTKVLMGDLSEKNIEEIRVGDKIMSVNMETMKLEKDLVVEIPNTDKKYRIIEAELDNGTTNKFSPAHPYWVKGKGWAVFDTEEAKTELEFKVNELKVGDVVLYYQNGVLKETVIKSLVDTGKYIEMYNVEFVEKNHTFFANKILVHNKRIN